MKEIMVYGTVILCFFCYGLWPFIASALLVFISDDPGQDHELYLDLKV
ncbi:MAG: hypothetical protein ACJAVX_004081 [Pseudoalteromonas rhizosphaerae]|jgi:hypothetical protein|nr:hypothetical protein [Pseudoalteromonas neustonica]